MHHNSDLFADASFLINPAFQFFSLPDFAFVNLDVPLACFDKRSCPQYHGVVDAVKGDAPLVPLLGDQEDEPTCTTTAGPQCSMSVVQEAIGDLDGLEGSTEHTVQTPYMMFRYGMTRPRDRGDAANNAVRHGNSLPQFGAPLVEALPLAEATDSEASRTTTADCSTLQQASSAGGEEAVSF